MSKLTARWYEWLVSLNCYLFDAAVCAPDETAARNIFANRIAECVQVPIDYDRARSLFLIRRLVDGDYSALKSLHSNKVDADWWHKAESAVLGVAGLLRKRASGQDVTNELADAAYDACKASTEANAARGAADVAFTAYHAACAAFWSADTNSYAVYHAASDVTDAAGGGGVHAAHGAARDDLIWALRQSQIKG